MAKINIPRHIPTPDEAHDQMFGISPQSTTSNMAGGIVKIEISKLIPYTTPDGEPQPFSLYNEEDLAQLAEGIKSVGVLSPIIVRPHKEKDGCYEIIAGHNRTNASKLAGLSTVPSIIKNVDDDEANIIMIDTNLDQRKELKHSELAKAYKMKLDLENKQGQRSDLTSRQNVVKFTPAEKRKAQRYARLTNLIPFLLVWVDEKQLPFMAGVELSYLSICNQQELFDYIEEREIKLTVEQSEKLRALEQEIPLNEDVLSNFFFPPKASKASTPKKITAIKINFVDIEEYVDTDREDLEHYIIKAICAFQEEEKTSRHFVAKLERRIKMNADIEHHLYYKIRGFVFNRKEKWVKQKIIIFDNNSNYREVQEKNRKQMKCILSLGDDIKLSNDDIVSITKEEYEQDYTGD